MADNKNKQKRNTAVDPYTGEKTPLAEDANRVDEVVPVDTGDRSGKNYLLEEETSMDSLAADEDADAVADEEAHFTEDEEVKSIFEERQEFVGGGRRELQDKLEEYHSKSPELSGGDLDADWQDADSAGEEAVGGTVPTPDQDEVDELGQALGVTYDDDEPIDGEEKLRERDRDRWELDPESARESAKPDG